MNDHEIMTEHIREDTEFHKNATLIFSQLSEHLTEQDKKIDAILAKVDPIDATYVFTNRLWKFLLGLLGLVSLIGGAVFAFQTIWHLMFPPKF